RREIDDLFTPNLTGRLTDREFVGIDRGSAAGTEADVRHDQTIMLEPTECLGLTVSLNRRGDDLAPCIPRFVGELHHGLTSRTGTHPAEARRTSSTVVSPTAAFLNPSCRSSLCPDWRARLVSS